MSPPPHREETFRILDSMFIYIEILTFTYLFFVLLYFLETPLLRKLQNFETLTEYEKIRKQLSILRYSAFFIAYIAIGYFFLWINYFNTSLIQPFIYFVAFFPLFAITYAKYNIFDVYKKKIFRQLSNLKSLSSSISDASAEIPTLIYRLKSNIKL